MTLKKNEYFIDISSYQENDARVYGVSKTIIKATEGTSYISPKKNYQANSSEPQGYYHFARFGGSVQQAQAESAFFVNNLPSKKVKYLVLDWEDSAGANKQANTDAVIAFMSFVKAKGYEPIFYGYVYYSADTVYLEQICAKFPKCLWLAGYAFGYQQRGEYTQADQNQMQANMSSKGILGLWKHVRWIQFTSTGVTPTYAGSLDKNVVLIDDDNTADILESEMTSNMFVYKAREDMGVISNEYKPFKKGAMFLVDISKRKAQYIGTAEQAETLTDPYFFGLKVKEEGATWFAAMLQRMARLPK